MMKQTIWRGQPISALSLGTVQLGVNYGINNQSGKPDTQTAFDILNTASEEGILALDTAAAYGDSELVIGEWMKSVSPEKRPFVMTKAKALDHSSLDALRSSLFSQVEESLQHLGLTQLPMLMLHNCEEYLQDKENVKTVFEELKAMGKIRFAGLSAYAHNDYGELAESGFDAVQIPINLFDWRQIDNGGLQKLKDSGMLILVRSVYLQGLVFQKPEELDPRMAFCYDTLVKFRTLCDEYKMSPAQLALSFAISLPGVNSLVLGSETAQQVRSNVELLQQAETLSDARMAQIHALFKDTPYNVLTPFTWYNA